MKRNFGSANSNIQDTRQLQKNPLNIIYRKIGSEITVYLKTGEIYTGKLKKIDNYMNLLLENAVEEAGEKVTRYGKTLIRGNNILLIKVGDI